MKIGIDIGGNHIAIGKVEGSNVLEKVEYEIREYIEKNNEDDIKKYILQILKEGIKKYISSEVEKITIGCAGTIKDGKIVKAENLKIYDFSLVDKLKNEFRNLEITLKNDAKCAAIAEKKYGVMKNYNDVVFLTIGTGIGGACFVNNSLVEPKRYSGFEYGHMVININGKECNCGSKGCFERYGAITALKEMVKKEFSIEEEFTGKELYEFIINGLNDSKKNKRMEKVLEEYTSNLALGISNIINILEPEIVVLGGSIVYYEEILLNRIQEKLFVFNRKDGIPQVKMAVLGNDAGII